MFPVIALITDFGTRDPFVGVMKGVIYGRCPQAHIVDLTHEIAPQAVVEGAFWLERCVPYFHGGTLFVAVIDPGVGTSRRAVVARACGQVLVAPDNGLITAVVEGSADSAAYEIDRARLGLPDPSATFHGRDVFAPVAADIASGRLDVADVGPRLDGLYPSPLPRARLRTGGVDGSIVTVDRFGNLITNVEERVLGGASDVVVRVGNASFGLVRTYAEIGHGSCAALVNSFGVLEIAQRDGSAAASLGARSGDRVAVGWRSA